MDQFTRILKLHQLLKNRHRRPVPISVITEKLECSMSTAKRAIRELRDLLHAPLEYDRRAHGYHYVTDGDSFELPGLWFSREELRTLVAFQDMLKGVGPGMLSDMLEPVIDRANLLLAINRPHNDPVERRFLFAGVQAKPIDSGVFTKVVGAMMKQHQLHIEYQGRHTGEDTCRDISPHRLLNYRSNWYLGAWCHLRDAMRTFALDRIKAAHRLETPAKEVDDETLSRVFDASYGIYSGEPTAWAVLCFGPAQAVWEAGAIWHRDQEARYLEDGRYELRIPFSSTNEIIHEILARIPDVEVVSPPELRALVQARLEEGIRRLKKKSPP